MRDDGKDEVTAVLLVFIAEVAIEISHDRRSCFALFHDVFNNPRTGQTSECMRTKTVEMTNHRTLLPDPATRRESEGHRVIEGKERTFAMDPQERRRSLPLFEYTALEEPRCCSLVVSLACYIVVGRGVRRREPILQFLS